LRYPRKAQCAAVGSLARRTAQQAASVEEKAAAPGQVTTAIADSSRGANIVGKLVIKTKNNAVFTEWTIHPAQRGDG